MSNTTTVNASTIQASTSSAPSPSPTATTSISLPTTSSATTTVTSPSPTTENTNTQMAIIIGIAVTFILVITLIIVVLVIRRKRSTNNPHNTPPARSDLVPENVDIPEPEQFIKRRASAEEHDMSPSHTDPQQTEFQERFSVASYIEPYTNYLNHRSNDSEREQSVYIDMKSPSRPPHPCKGPENKSRYVNVDDNDDNQGIYANDENTCSTTYDQSENYVHSENISDDIYVNTAYDQDDYVNAPEKQKPLKV